MIIFIACTHLENVSMPRLMLICLTALLLVSCTAKHSKQNTFTPSNLESFLISIDHTKDYLFRTPKGAVIRIKKGTFAVDEQLEIKEAYSMKEIMLAGLSTESNGKPLKSGGMIYINVKDGSAPQLNNPISIAIPALSPDKDMSLYKGEPDADSTINWNKTDTVQPAGASEKIDSIGKLIFLRNCGTCHALDKVITGPALRGTTKRGPWINRANLHRWVHNPGAFIPTTLYTSALQKTYGQIMPSFPQLSDKDIDAVFDYIKNAPANADTERTAFLDKLEKSTCFDTTYYDERDTAIISDNTIQELFNDTVTYNQSYIQDQSYKYDTAAMLEKQKWVAAAGFTDEEISDGAYRFEIKTLGWYNVDSEVRGLANTLLCKLTANITPANLPTQTSVYVFFPQQKMLIRGLMENDGNIYFGDDKQLGVYKNTEGILLAFGNKGDQFYYGIKRFDVAPVVNVSIPVHPSTQDELLQAVKNEKLEGINMDVVKQQMQVVPCRTKLDTSKTQDMLKIIEN